MMSDEDIKEYHRLGMKVLKARERVSCTHKPLEGITPEVVEVPLKDLMMTADYKWMMKRYPKFKKSIDSAGMKYPIIYTDLENYWLPDERWPKDEKGNCIEGIAVHTGNKRVYWAKQNGYDQIEGYKMTTIEHKRDLRRLTSINHTEIPK